jgi:hypothetical protein
MSGGAGLGREGVFCCAARAFQTYSGCPIVWASAFPALPAFLFGQTLYRRFENRVAPRPGAPLQFAEKLPSSYLWAKGLPEKKDLSQR